MKAAIRADASSVIGSGHVMRCKTLADTLRGLGVEVRFICREHAGNLISLLRAANYRTAVLPAPAAWRAGSDAVEADYAAWVGAEQSVDAEQTLEALRDFNPDWLVVDHYGLDATWESLVRPQVGHIFTIDDLANRHHDCDLLLDQNFFAVMENRYAGLIPHQARQLLGPRFALLRPEFERARATLRKRDGTVRRVLVFFGGVDRTEETGKVLEALHNCPDIALDVVVGGANPRADAIEAQCGGEGKVTFHRQVSNMADLMTAADFSFGAGGTSHWERCCLGLPAAVTVVAPNQSDTTRDLAERGVVLMSGFGARISVSRYRSILDTLTSEQLLAMQSAALALVDGRGAERVALSLCLEPVVLRRAGAEDAVRAWSWRNHPSTRRQSSDPRTVTLPEHIVWWKNSLENPGRVLLIGSQSGVEVGVLRYDNGGQGRAVASIYVDPALHGLGLGVSLLKAGQEWLAAHQPEVREIEAVILPDNVPSQRAFAKAGFRFQHNRWVWNRRGSGG